MELRIRTALPYLVSAALLTALIWGTVGDWKLRKWRAETYAQSTLHGRAREALAKGVKEVRLGFGADGMEGEMWFLPNFDAILHAVMWVVGEPIEEKTVVLRHEPDDITTAYRVRVLEKFGFVPSDWRSDVDQDALSIMEPKAGEIVILKSGGDIRVDGVLFKKRGPACFSELLPRRYLFGLLMSKSGRAGILAMGCKSINLVDGDRIQTTEETDPVMNGFRDRFHNSLAEFRASFAPNPR